MSDPLRTGFCVSGKGRLFQEAVRHRNLLGIDPTLAVLGYGADPGLEGFCVAHGITPVRMEHARGPELNDALELALVPADLGLVALTFDHLIPPPVVRHYRGRMVNLHLALLPAFPGFRAIPKALAGGVRFAGATVHEVDETMDGGPIIAQAVVGLRRDDTTETVGARVFAAARPMFLQVLRWFAAGRVERDPDGRVWVRGAEYGALPVSPAVEECVLKVVGTLRVPL